MVNASLNWASIVGIVLAVCGAGLYFLRSFKPALARDYDVFFAAIGLLCGGILFFQGWRLDPILQFGQFLLAGTTVFFAYESVRLRGVATDQARRSSYFDDDLDPARFGSGGSRREWDDSADRFEDSESSSRRRFVGGDYPPDSRDEDLYGQRRRPSRRAIPEEAESRRASKRIDNDSWENESVSARRMARFSRQTDDERESANNFGQRRNLRQDQRRGSRPISNKQTSSRRRSTENQSKFSTPPTYSSSKGEINRGKSVMGRKTEDAAFYPSSSVAGERLNLKEKNDLSKERNRNSDNSSSSNLGSNSRNLKPRSTRQRDNNSRFDD